jgi:hypothetical protein
VAAETAQPVLKLGYELVVPRFEFRQGQKIFSSPKRSDRLLGPFSLLFNGYRRSFPGPRRPGRDVYPSPSRTEVMNKWGYIYFPPIRLHEVDRGNVYCPVNLLQPTGHVIHQQFNIQQLYALPTLYLCVLYLSENKQRLVPLTA